MDEMDVDRFEIAKDVIVAKYMKMERSVCFQDNMIFADEVPLSEHNRPNLNMQKLGI